MLSKKPGEGDIEYHRRLLYGKLVDHTLSDVDYTELAPLLYGQGYSSDVTRRMMYGSCRTMQLIDSVSGKDNPDTKAPTPSRDGEALNARRVEFEIARQRFLDQRKAYMEKVRERSREEELNDIIRRSITEGVKSGVLTDISAHCSNEIASTDQDAACLGDQTDLLVSLNDIHYGASVHNYWCDYDSDACLQMLANYIGRIVDIGRRHNSRSCIVWANGDLISGNIHYQIAVSNNENVMQQVIGVSEAITGFLLALSRHFESVKYVSVAGNHSRIDIKDRALINERLDDLVEWYLKARFQSVPNVEIGYGERIDPTMYLMNVRGKNYVGVHGDYDPTPQHIQALQTMVGGVSEKPVYAVLMGHKHHNAINNVQGVKTIMAGGFVGMDDFCVQKRIYGNPEQLVCVCDDSGVICSYDIDLKA